MSTQYQEGGDGRHIPLSAFDAEIPSVIVGTASGELTATPVEELGGPLSSEDFADSDYTVNQSSDWTPEPAHPSDALDQLAARLTIVEDAPSSGFTVDGSIADLLYAGGTNSWTELGSPNPNWVTVAGSDITLISGLYSIVVQVTAAADGNAQALIPLKTDEDSGNEFVLQAKASNATATGNFSGSVVVASPGTIYGGTIGLANIADNEVRVIIQRLGL